MNNLINFQYAMRGCDVIKDVIMNQKLVKNFMKKVISEKTFCTSNLIMKFHDWNLYMAKWQNEKEETAMLNLAKRVETSWTLNLEIICKTIFNNFYRPIIITDEKLKSM